MQKSFNEFQNLFNNKDLRMKNKHLQAILYKMEFLFLPNNVNDLLQKYPQCESKIFIIDEYRDENESKYLFVCFDSKLIILSFENSFQCLNNFLSKHDEYPEKYFLKKKFNFWTKLENRR